MRLIVIIFLLCISTFSLLSQNYNESELETILEKISAETGSSPLIDEIEKYIEKPLSLKNATVEELVQIPGFSTSIARLILEITYYSDADYDDIDAKLNLTDEQMYLLKLCTTLEESPKIAKRKSVYIRLRNQNRFQTQSGFETDSFKGTSLNLYQKSTLYYKNISAGFLFDKDPGEQFVTNFSTGFISGNVSNTRFIMGDFYVENGMGSILWKSYGMRKGAEVISPVMQIGSGIKPYRSSVDYNFFRGMALQSNWEFSKDANLSSIFWISFSPRAANIDSSGCYVTSVYTTGYYRTNNEIQKKNKLIEKSLGGNLELQLAKLKFGFTSYFMDYSKEITSTAKNTFSGKSGFLSSAYGFLFFDNSSFAAEVCSDSKGNLGGKSSVQIKLGDLEFACHYRYFMSNFRSPYGYNLGESDAPANEKGLYTGLLWKITRKFNISLYADLYKNISATENLPIPKKGIDVFSEIVYDFASRTRIRMRLRNENSIDNYKIDSVSYSSYTKNISRVRLDLIQGFGKKIRAYIRGEIVYSSFRNIKPDEKGFLTFADLSWEPHPTLQLGGRITYFSTDSYDSAIWQFESIVPGYYLTFPMYGKGIKLFIYAGYTPFDAVTLGLRYSILTKSGVESLGSDYNEIQGNKDSRLYLELDVRL
ncbi:MAG: hypothetical protein EPN82_13780 [Bacteroidetes bacterium]|nr:MAG: hypothetical protein EPN82_13780 [Bacteroidota bacterium]